MLKYAMYGTSKEHTSLSLYCALAFYVNQPKSILSVKCNLTFRLWCGSYVKQECLCCFFFNTFVLKNVWVKVCTVYIYCLIFVSCQSIPIYISKYGIIYWRVCEMSLLNVFIIISRSSYCKIIAFCIFIIYVVRQLLL